MFLHFQIKMSANNQVKEIPDNFGDDQQADPQQALTDTEGIDQCLANDSFKEKLVIPMGRLANSSASSKYKYLSFRFLNLISFHYVNLLGL